MFRPASPAARRLLGGAVLLVLGVGLFWLLRGQSLRSGSGPAGRLTPAQAESLVRAYQAAHQPNLNPAARFPMTDITTPETWQRLRAQVFRAGGEVAINQAFLIYNDRVYPLGQAFGGSGVQAMVVADLDADQAPELIYTYNFGSGINQSSLGIVSVVENQPRLAEGLPDYHYLGELRLEKQDDRTVRVLGIRADAPRAELLGRVQWTAGKLTVNPDPGS